jgi:phosphoribosylamine--glycine ligase
MRVLVLGSGGREHALVWRLKRDPDVDVVLAAPGNPGIGELAKRRPVDLTAGTDVLQLAERERVDLTVVGPEAPLEKGLADIFRRAGRPVVGPNARGAALECSKAWAKDFMARHGIPTARYQVCDTPEAAMTAVAGDAFGFPVVVKADGLAAGKGVIVAETRQEAEDAVRAAMLDNQFGSAGARLVIEECLTGPEVSFFVLTDGERVLPLGTAQDHKRIFDDDKGPNTGGMGAFAPSPLVDVSLTSSVMRTIVQPVIDGMRAEGDPFIGFLYVSLMLTTDGPKVIEFNVRFGDPEAQVVLPLVEGPFAKVLLAAANGDLGRFTLGMADAATVGVVIAAHGYPGHVSTGDPIEGITRAAARPNTLVFHASTAMDNGTLVTAGGRVLTVVGRGATHADAMATAYASAAEITFKGMQFRKDIGRKAFAAARPRH